MILEILRESIFHFFKLKCLHPQISEYTNKKKYVTAVIYMRKEIERKRKKKQ